MDAALPRSDWHEAIQECLSITMWTGIPSSVLGAATGYVIISTSATAGALFGGVAAVTFITVFIIIRLVEAFFRKELMSNRSRMLFPIIAAPIGGWAVCAAAGFALTALQVIALTISSYVGGAFGLHFGAQHNRRQRQNSLV